MTINIKIEAYSTNTYDNHIRLIRARVRMAEHEMSGDDCSWDAVEWYLRSAETEIKETSKIAHMFNLKESAIFNIWRTRWKKAVITYFTHGNTEGIFVKKLLKRS